MYDAVYWKQLLQPPPPDQHFIFPGKVYWARPLLSEFWWIYVYDSRSHTSLIKIL